MTARVATAYPDRLKALHSVALALTCCALLSLNLPQSGSVALPNWSVANDYTRENYLDAALQQAAESALGGREGTIIVMEAQTGRVRAVVNPQVAFAQIRMPGSTIKPFTALAALRSGLIDANSRSVCPGRFKGLSFSVACVHDNHLPPFTPSQAIAYSCNYYFATLGERLKKEELVTTLRGFGFGQPTGLNSKEERGMLRPCDSAVYPTVRSAKQVDSSTDCNAREAIGASARIEGTPIQLLTSYAAIVNGGHLFQPTLAMASAFRPVERSSINIAPEHRSIITEGMAGAVRYGTARSVKLDSLPLYLLGKTGTALPPKGFRTNGWFIGFAAPLENNSEVEPSKIDLAVLVLLDQAHGAEAAALAKPIFEVYANATSGRETLQRISKVSPETGDLKPANSAIGNPQSAIRIHLVHENVTQELSLEDYVLGVMRAEGATETEPEALKALAIAIRTFALKNRGRHAKDGYDFCSTTHCQRFVDSVRSSTVREGALNDRADTQIPDRIVQAVRATGGQVLLDEHGQIVDSYFSASCGGETANIGTLWGVTPPDYLRGVGDEYCLTGPHASWTDVIKRDDLLRALRSDGRTNVGARLNQVIIARRDRSGRAEFITLEGEHQKTVRGWDFKIIVGRVLGWNVLKSSRFEVSRIGSDFVFRGRGFGHGLGLCQEGAHVMAARGLGYQKILEKYFPGTRILAPGGGLSLVRPFKAGRANVKDQVALATAEFGRASPAPERLAKWRADILPLFDGGITLAPSLTVGFPQTRSRFVSISSDHFRINYPAGIDRREADLVLSTLENARSDFLRRVSAASIPTDITMQEMRLNQSTGDFTSRSGQPWWAGAATKGNRIELQPVALLKRRGVLITTLRHELAHAVIDMVSHNRAPRWLEEGFAIYLAGEGQSISRYATKAKMTTDELERKLERPSSQQEMRALYALAYQKVVELVRSDSETGVWRRLTLV